MNCNNEGPGHILTEHLYQYIVLGLVPLLAFCPDFVICIVQQRVKITDAFLNRKMHKMRVLPGLRPDPAGELTALPQITGLRGLYF